MSRKFTTDIQVNELATPATPDTGTAKIYPKSDGKWYTLNDTGTEIEVVGTTSSLSAKGDILVHNGTNVVKQTVGADGLYLKANSGASTGVEWASAAANLSVASKVFGDSPYTASTSDDVILYDATGGASTINLPTAVGNTGKVFRIKKTDSSANAVTIDPNSTETIDGDSTWVLRSEDDLVAIVSDGSNWHVVAKDFKTKYLAADSSVKTPSASGNYSSMTGNSVTLTPGSWHLHGQIYFTNSGGAATYSEAYGYWATTAGADNSTPPTALVADGGVKTHVGRLVIGSMTTLSCVGMVRVTVTSNTTVYLVPYAAMSTAANSRITAFIVAERIK